MLVRPGSRIGAIRVFLQRTPEDREIERLAAFAADGILEGIILIGDHHQHTHDLLASVSELADKRVPITSGRDTDVHLHPHRWVHFADNARRLASGAVSRATPTYAEISLTLTCNFSCRQCTSGTWKARTRRGEDESKFMTWPRVEQTLEFCRSAGIKTVLFAAGGEPTLHPRLLDAVRLARQYGFAVGLYSNGTFDYCDDDLSELLSLLDLFRISLHAANVQSHMKYHRLSSPMLTMRVLQNVARCARLNAARAHPCNYGVNNVINEHNCHTAEELVEFLHDVAAAHAGGLRFAQFTPEVRMRPTDEWGRDDNALVPQRPEAFYAALAEQFDGPARDRLESVGVAVMCSYWDMATRRRRHKRCGGTAWYMTEIDPSGNLYFCTQHSGNPDYWIGNIFASSFEEIWWGERRMRLLTEARDFDKCPPTCKQMHMNETVEEVEGLSEDERVLLLEWVSRVASDDRRDHFL